MNNKFKNSLNNETQTENKWCARLAYKCGICDKEHESIQERAECELSCLRKKEEAERIAAAQKRIEERAARKKAVDEAFDKAYKLKDEYIKDYGSYAYSYMSDDDEDEYDIWMSPSFAEFLRMLP